MSVAERCEPHALCLRLGQDRVYRLEGRDLRVLGASFRGVGGEYLEHGHDLLGAQQRIVEVVEVYAFPDTSVEESRD